MRVFRLAVTQLSCSCYDQLWDIKGDHQGVEGWPFVSKDELRHYFANRDAALTPKNTNSMEEPQLDPGHTSISRVELDIYGRVWDKARGLDDSYRRNPLCAEGSSSRCFLYRRSNDFPHACDNTGRITCKKDPAVCNFTCSGKARNVFERHFKRYHESFPCTVPGCKRVAERAFTRKDNLTQHIRKVHKKFIPRVEVRFSTGGWAHRRVIDQHPQDPRLGTFELAAVPSGIVNGEDASAEASGYNGGESSVAFERVEEEEYQLE